jgi:predicted ester cyclase
VHSPDENRQRIVDAVAAFNRGDLDGYLSSYAEAAAIHRLPADIDPSPAGLRLFLERLLSGLPDLRVTIDDTVAEGDRVAVRMTYRGTHRGELFGYAPTWRVVEWNGLTIRRVGADGRTAERWTRNDVAALRSQLDQSAASRNSSI